MWMKINPGKFFELEPCVAERISKNHKRMHGAEDFGRVSVNMTGTNIALLK